MKCCVRSPVWLVGSRGHSSQKMHYATNKIWKGSRDKVVNELVIDGGHGF